MKPLTALICCVMATSLAAAQEAKPDKNRVAIDRGLAWLIKDQRKDGSWPTDKSSFPSATTALAGMALLADGSTLDEGKYKANLRRAMDWFLKFQAKEKKYHGLLADPNAPGSVGRYMPEHGVALSFLAQLFGQIEKTEDRARLRKRLSEAVAFAVAGQSSDGGWFYTSKIEGHDTNENVSTMLVLQGLLDARNAGIAVPKDTIRKASRHLENCTDPRGGIVYSGGGGRGKPTGGGRPIITAMALAAWIPNLQRYDSTTRRWLAFCAESSNLTVEKQPRLSTDLLVHYYVNKVVYHLDEKEWETAFPDKKLPDLLNRAKYRAAMFDRLRKEQHEDGSWPQVWSPGSAFNTALALNILLYEDSQPLRWTNR